MKPSRTSGSTKYNDLFTSNIGKIFSTSKRSRNGALFCCRLSSAGRFINLAAFLIFLITSPLVGQTDTLDIVKLDNYLTALEEADRFMGSVAILIGDEAAFHQAYGIVDEEGNRATTDTRYRIGSITKTFTATTLLALAEEGKVSLDETLENYFPEMPNADKITIEHLLRHQSGLVNFTNKPEYLEYHTEEISREELLEMFIEYGVSFEPGERGEYSNTGYVLLGYIIEKITGLEYGSALEHYILQPMGLNNTYMGDAIDLSLGEAQSYSYRSGWNPATETNLFIPHGAGALVSTSLESARFMRELMQGELLPEHRLEEMARMDHNFGIGLIQIPFYNSVAFGHTGGIDGFHSIAAHFPEEDYTFSVTMNGLNYNANDIYIGILSILFGREFEIPDLEKAEELVLSTKEMLAYAGTYTSDQIPFPMDLFVEGDRMMGQLAGQPSFPLTIVDETTLTFDQAGVVLKFEAPESGRYRTFVLHQFGQEITFNLSEESQ